MRRYVSAFVEIKISLFFIFGNVENYEHDQVKANFH